MLKACTDKDHRPGSKTVEWIPPRGPVGVQPKPQNTHSPMQQSRQKFALFPDSTDSVTGPFRALKIPKSGGLGPTDKRLLRNVNGGGRASSKAKKHGFHLTDYLLSSPGAAQSLSESPGIPYAMIEAVKAMATVKTNIAIRLSSPIQWTMSFWRILMPYSD